MTVRQQRGVALALVIWFIAAMTLLVAGIVSMARLDTRGTQLQLAKAKVVAAGDGAIHLAMVERSVGFSAGADGPLVSETTHLVGAIEVKVRIYPGDGLVDLNSASADILAALFRFAAQIPPAEAQALADNVVKWRGAGALSRQSGDPVRFESFEDLLRVDGVNRTLLDAIRDYVVPGDWVRGGVDWSAAPQEVFSMLQSVSPELAERAERRRQVLGGGETPRQAGGLGGQALYRADAVVEYAGRSWLRRRWLRSGSSRDSALPWVVLRNEAPRVIEGSR